MIFRTSIFAILTSTFMLAISCRQSHNSSSLREDDGRGGLVEGIQSSGQNKSDTWVFIMAGQSNMAGRGKVEAQDTITDHRILTIDSAGQVIIAREPLHFYEPSRVGLDCGMSFARALITSIPDDVSILILPTAVGGSSIDQWLGDSTHRGVRLLSNFRAKVDIGRHHGEFKGILWHQGESDATPPRIAVYKRKLASLISTFRSIVGNDGLPVLMGELGSFGENRDNRMMINAAMWEYAQQDSNVRIVSTSDLSHKGDGTHFDSRSQRAMGERFARQYLDWAKGRNMK